MLNRVVLVGRLTRDPELRVSQSNVAVATFNLAVNRPFTSQNGERGADFINCVVFRKQAENVNQYVKKGSLVGIDGRIQTRNYENKDGQRVYVTEVVVDNFALLESRKDREARGQNGGYTPNNGNNSTPSTNNFQNNGGSQNNNPQNNNNQNNAQDPFAGSGDTIDISDDDLPF